MDGFKLVEVPLKCSMLVPVGIGTSYLIILDHPTGLKALWFEKHKLEKIEDIDEVDTFEEAVALAKESAQEVSLTEEGVQEAGEKVF